MNKIKSLAISIGIIYIWFGALKFFTGMSPAESLGSETIHALSLQLIPIKIGNFLLAILEVFIGFGIIYRRTRKAATLLALGHMLLTFTPLIIFPEQIFTGPFAFTMVGQYIMKNIVIIMALLIILQKNENTADHSLQSA